MVFQCQFKSLFSCFWYPEPELTIFFLFPHHNKCPLQVFEFALTEQDCDFTPGTNLCIRWICILNFIFFSQIRLLSTNGALTNSQRLLNWSTSNNGAIFIIDQFQSQIISNFYTVENKSEMVIHPTESQNTAAWLLINPTKLRLHTWYQYWSILLGIWLINIFSAPSFYLTRLTALQLPPRFYFFLSPFLSSYGILDLVCYRSEATPPLHPLLPH